MNTTSKAHAPLPPVEQLWELYRELGSVHKVEEVHGWGHARVHRALRNAGYKFKSRTFSEEELQTIRQYYAETPPETFSLDELALTMDRPKTGICRHAGLMGLTQKFRPPNEAASVEIAQRMKTWHQRNPHPRGMLGKKHTPEVCAAMGPVRRAMWAALTEDERAAKSMKMLKTKAERGNIINHRPHTTWKAGWHEIGGKRHYFRSRWEVNYAYYLQWLKDRNQLKDWEFEPKTFWFEGVKRGTMSYLPDFRVTENNGEQIYHEVKGWMDERSATKLKRMAKYYPDVKLILIDSKTYKALALQVKTMIPEWE